MQRFLHGNPTMVPVIVLILSVVAFGLIAGGRFFSPFNLSLIMQQVAIVGILAAGQSLIILTAGIDLSVAAVMVMISVIMGRLGVDLGVPVPLAIAAGLCCGLITGWINGTLVTKIKLPPFIATLGMMYIARGLALIISGLSPMYFTDIPVFRDIATGSVMGSVIPGFDIPNAVLILFGAAVVGSFLLFRTVLGRYTFAIGSNEEATRLSGVNVDRWKIAEEFVVGAELGRTGAGAAGGARPVPAGLVRGAGAPGRLARLGRGTGAGGGRQCRMTCSCPVAGRHRWPTTSRRSVSCA